MRTVSLSVTAAIGYTRSDVVKLLKLKDTFAPYVDRFSRDSLDVNGHPAAKAEEVRDSLNQILADLEAHS